MNYLTVRNWDTWQSYRADRGQPPWIKLHRALLRDVEWGYLTDAQKGQLASMWMLAADKGGKIPNDPKIIKKFCGLDKEPDLELFVGHGFLEGDAKVTPTRRQVDANMTPQSRSEEDRVEAEAEVAVKTASASYQKNAQEVLNHLNTKAGKSYTVTKHIEACFKREGCTVAQCKSIINFKSGQWKGTDMEKNLNPKTPWRAIHFKDYLDEAGAQAAPVADNRKRDEWGRVIPQWELDLMKEDGDE